jgi:hypothetical protein
MVRLAGFYRRSPDRISEREIQAHLLHPYREKGLSHSTCNLAVAGLRFFYHVTLWRPSTSFVIPAAREPSKLLVGSRAGAVARRISLGRIRGFPLRARLAGCGKMISPSWKVQRIIGFGPQVPGSRSEMR